MERRSEEKSVCLNQETESIKWDISTISKIFINIVLFIIVAIPILGNYIYDAHSFRRGFFCDDETIKYPYKEDTITDEVLYDVGYSFPSIMIFLNEFYETFSKHGKKSLKSKKLRNNFMFDLCQRLYCRVGVFLFGAFINEIFTNSTKLVIGRLRPNFIDVCRPSVDCASQKDPYAYILNFTCTSNHPKIEESRKSFPSGHSTFSFYTLLYLTIYFQFCVVSKTSKLLKPSLQIGFLLVAWLTAMSRISDNKHHWSDVTVGIILGITIAVLVIYFISDIIPKHSPKPTCKDDCNNCQ